MHEFAKGLAVGGEKSVLRVLTPDATVKGCALLGHSGEDSGPCKKPRPVAPPPPCLVIVIRLAYW